MTIAGCLLMISLIASGASQPLPPIPRPHVLGLAPAETLAILGPALRWDLMTGPDTLFQLTRAQAESLAAAADTYRQDRPCQPSRWRTLTTVLALVIGFAAAKL